MAFSDERIIREQIIPYLALPVRKLVAGLPGEDLTRLEEIRLRCGKPVLLKIGERDISIDPRGNLTTKISEGYRVEQDDIYRTIAAISDNSLYAFEEEIRRGYITLRGGHRAGLAGQIVMKKDEGQFIYNDSKTHKEMFAIYTSSDFTGWKYIAVVPEDELTCAAPAITKGILRISSLCLILAVVIAFIISLYISKPINEVTKAMAMAESGNLNVRVKYNSNDELGRLSRGFNNMVEKINKLIEEEYKYKLLINKEKLELLQMQINPHLLYNTLAMVSYKARKENKIQIVEIAENLSNFYKGILSKGKNISTFREEVDMIKTYVSLAKSVYEIDINAIYEIDETIYDLFTLKLLMQPIVENSIIHGLKPKRGGILLVSAYIEDNNVNVIISDDGIGMDKAIVDQLNSITSYEDVYDQDAYEGYGISNVIKRIKLFFGDEYGINIDSNYDQGTTVIVKLPVIKQIDKQII